MQHVLTWKSHRVNTKTQINVYKSNEKVDILAKLYNTAYEKSVKVKIIK